MSHPFIPAQILPIPQSRFVWSVNYHVKLVRVLKPSAQHVTMVIIYIVSNVYRIVLFQHLQICSSIFALHVLQTAWSVVQHLLVPHVPAEAIRFKVLATWRAQPRLPFHICLNIVETVSLTTAYYVRGQILSVCFVSQDIICFRRSALDHVLKITNQTK